MKGTLYYLFIPLVLALTLVSCSKQPNREIEDARTAVDFAIGEGAEKYAPAEARKLNDSLTAALDEVRRQDSRFLKDYTKAKDMLAGVKTDAEKVKAGLEEKKGEAKERADAAIEVAKKALDEASNLLDKPSGSRGAKIDTDHVTADMNEIETLLTEALRLSDGEDYNAASEKAREVKERAAEVSVKMREALEKPVGKK